MIKMKVNTSKKIVIMADNAFFNKDEYESK